MANVYKYICNNRTVVRAYKLPVASTIMKLKTMIRVTRPNGERINGLTDLNPKHYINVIKNQDRL